MYLLLSDIDKTYPANGFEKESRSKSDGDTYIPRAEEKKLKKKHQPVY